MADHPDILLARRSAGPLVGAITPPGDKSVSHRALILSTLADGQSTIRGLLRAADVEATAHACHQLGAGISMHDELCHVEGVGLHGLSRPGGPLDMGNSGTAMRLLAGVLAAQRFDSVLTGDESLQQRPMTRIARPLRQMGAKIETRENGCAPIRIEGNQSLRGISYHSPVASAQVKSCVLLAGLYASGQTSVVEPAPSRDHTERMLRAFAADISAAGAVRGGSRLTAVDLEVPADISSAAFFIVAACIVPGSRLLIRNVGLNPTRAGILKALDAMGCDIRIMRQRHFGVEPVGDLEVCYREGAKAVEIGAQDIPAIIDELPVLMVAAAVAGGVTRIRDAAELRIKESDRIAVMARGLSSCGFTVREYEDGIEIEGQPPRPGAAPVSPRSPGRDPVVVDGAGDHRCAMSFCILAQAMQRPVEVHGAAQIETSFPTFVRDFSSLGADIRQQEGEH